ncbi:hypothetical protein HZS_3068 [Henneguya salminicola]|nr:hypothetical protein HZS_3068 [Henneguya salminicola]
MRSKLSRNEYYTFKPGEKINGHYWAHSQIGKGSYGTVIRGYDYKKGTDVAIKFLKSGRNFSRVGEAEVKILDLIHKYNKKNSYSIMLKN